MLAYAKKAGLTFSTWARKIILASMGMVLSAQTQVEPCQIRNWSQVAMEKGRGVTLEQVALPRRFWVARKLGVWFELIVPGRIITQNGVSSFWNTGKVADKGYLLNTLEEWDSE